MSLLMIHLMSNQAHPISCEVSPKDDPGQNQLNHTNPGQMSYECFCFFVIFHSSDSYESPFLDQIWQRIRSEKEKLLHQLQSTSLFLKCEDIRWQGSKHIS